MRKTVQVLALLLTLCASTHAGDMQFPVVPPPPTPNAVQEPTTDGVMDCGLTGIILGLLSSVLP